MLCIDIIRPELCSRAAVELFQSHSFFNYLQRFNGCASKRMLPANSFVLPWTFHPPVKIKYGDLPRCERNELRVGDARGTFPLSIVAASGLLMAALSVSLARFNLRARTFPQALRTSVVLMGLAQSRGAHTYKEAMAAAAEAPAGSERAIVAGGCFWCIEVCLPQKLLRQLISVSLPPSGTAPTEGAQPHLPRFRLQPEHTLVVAAMAQLAFGSSCVDRNCTCRACSAA